MTFADTNWLVAMFFEVEKDGRTKLVKRFLRHFNETLCVSAMVLLEARVVFSRESGESLPKEWQEFEACENFYRDPMNWDMLRREVFLLAARYASKAKVGTLDLAVLAGAKLGGATRLLTFDDTLAALAVAEGLEVFPELSRKGKEILAML